MVKARTSNDRQITPQKGNIKDGINRDMGAWRVDYPTWKIPIKIKMTTYNGKTSSFWVVSYFSLDYKRRTFFFMVEILNINSHKDV